MKTINETAIEIANKNYHSEFTVCADLKRSCREMAELIQYWIPVEEELPENKSHNFSDLVLTKNKFGDIRLERYDFEFNHFNSARYDAIVDGDGQVTHWRPIERE